MQLAVFGGTGKTGRLVVEQALAAGHSVTVLARNPAKLTLQNPCLRVVQGDIGDAAKVLETVKGADAVISALGPTSNQPDFAVSKGMTNIIAAMRQAGVKRLIVTAGAGVRDPMDQPKLVDKVIVTMLKLLNGNVLADMQQAVQQVQASDLDWTIVRGPRLTDEPPTGNIRAGGVGKDIGTSLTRGDFAAFLLAQLNNSQWVRKMPAISN
jgi:putative NADH-flavin reductase